MARFLVYAVDYRFCLKINVVLIDMLEWKNRLVNANHKVRFILFLFKAVLNMNHLQGPFLILILGIIGGVLLLLLEMLA